MSNLRRNVLSRGVHKTNPLRFSLAASKDCTPVKWSKYFSNQRQVVVNGNSFNVYSSGTTGTVLLLVHGGGYSALTWSLFSEEIINKIECQVLAVDLRGHGDTKTEDDENLSLEIMAKDLVDFVNMYFSDGQMPPIVLIGHSMGGAVAVEAAALIDAVIALCVIDVVEGTALESLSSMQSILRGRPSNFKSVEQAIQWSFRGGQTHNLEAARVSMPGQIKNIVTGELAANEAITNSTPINAKELTHQLSADAIEEENEDEEQTPDKLINETHSEPIPNNRENIGLPPVPNQACFKKPSTDFSEPNKYTWRIDLSKTEPFWTGWFRNLSHKFLCVHVPKVLLLANIHGLDTTLTVGQMQGKFQLQVLPKSGHAIHEDQPQHVADVIAGFLVKQKLTVAKDGFTPLMPAC